MMPGMPVAYERDAPALPYNVISDETRSWFEGIQKPGQVRIMAWRNSPRPKKAYFLQVYPAVFRYRVDHICDQLEWMEAHREAH